MSVLARPTPLEIYTSVQQALATHVIPELQTDDARFQLGSALGLFRYLATEFEGAADTLCHEISELTDALIAVLTPLREAGHADLAARLKVAIDNEAPDLRIPSLLAHCDELQEALLQALLLLEPEAEAGNSSLIGSRDTLREALVAFNQRQSA